MVLRRGGGGHCLAASFGPARADCRQTRWDGVASAGTAKYENRPLTAQGSTPRAIMAPRGDGTPLIPPFGTCRRVHIRWQTRQGVFCRYRSQTPFPHSFGEGFGGFLLPAGQDMGVDVHKQCLRYALGPEDRNPGRAKMMGVEPYANQVPLAAGERTGPHAADGVGRGFVSCRVQTPPAAYRSSTGMGAEGWAEPSGTLTAISVPRPG